MSTDAPVKHNATTDTAKEWCREARKIVGLGIAGEAKKMKVASNKIHEELGKLEKLYKGELPPELKKCQQDYVDLAWELKHLEEEYRKFEEKEKLAHAEYYGRLSDDKKKKKIWKPVEEEARQSKDNVRNRLIEKAGELQTLETELSKALTQKKNAIEEQESSITDKAQLKIISDGQAAEEKAQELISFFKSNYDAQSSGLIAEEYSVYDKKGLNWYDNGKRGNAARNNKKEAIDAFNLKWEEEKEAYKSGKGTYDKSIKEIRVAMVKVESLLSANARKQVLNFFYEGQDAALRKNWKLAGKNINPELLATINRLLKDVEGAYDEWVELKKTDYANLRTKLENLNDPHFMNLGLSPLAEAVALAEETKDYVSAANDLRSAASKAEEVISVAETSAVKLQEYEIILREAINKVSALTGTALGLAIALPEKIQSEINAFRDALHVTTMAELQKVIRKHEQAILAIEAEIAACQDPNKVAEKEKEIADKKDVGPYIDGLNAAASNAHNAIFDYEGLGADPVGDPALVAPWQQKIEAARTFIKSLERVQKNGDLTNFDKHTEFYNKHIAALEQVTTDANKATTTASGQVKGLQRQLQAKLKELKTVLSNNRWMTLREATWHGKATEEKAEIESAAATGCLSLLKEKIARVEKMIDSGNKALDYYFAQDSEVEPPDPRYDILKSRFSALVRKLNDRKLKATLPKEREKLLTEVLAAQNTLRNEGPGLMDDNHADWVKMLETPSEGFEPKKDELFLLLARLKSLRDELTNQAKSIRAKIGSELVGQLKVLTGKEINADHLPISGRLATVEAGLMAETLEALNIQKKKLDNVALELEFTLDEGRELVAKKQVADQQGTTFDMAKEGGEAFAEIAKEGQKAEQKERQRIDALLELRSKYNDTVELYLETRARLKKVKELDTAEYERIVTLYKEGKGAAEKQDWGAAFRKVDLAYRMALHLESDPLASQTTERGRKHLKELNPRWTGGIGTLLGSVEKLSEAIGKSAADDPEVGGADKVTGPFNDLVVSRMTNALEADAFQQELLILSSDPPKKKADKEKDLAKKRKIREQALTKVRRFHNIVSKDTVFTSLMYENNPWSKQGGAVMGLPLMRALNDLDLNLQRSV